MTPMKFFYYIKPFIPRKAQIYARQNIAQLKYFNNKDKWPIDPSAAAIPPGWPGWPDNKKFALVLSHDVESLPGRDKCNLLMELEENRGFKSSFNFVPEKYEAYQSLRDSIVQKGFQVCVHGLKHDGKLFSSKKIFLERVKHINDYLSEWNSTGFTSPSMHHNLEWMQALNITHDTSTFDTDPFEPQPDGVGTIFPFWVQDKFSLNGYVELPYTLPQDFTLFAILKNKNIDIWKQKIDWIAKNGGMVLVNTHPDYMIFDKEKDNNHTFYPIQYYEELLDYVKNRYADMYWNALPKEVAEYYISVLGRKTDSTAITIKNLNCRIEKRLKLLDREIKNSKQGILYQSRTIAIIDPLKNSSWDEFVENHSLGWICHLSGWKKVLEDTYKHMKGFYVVKMDYNTNNIQAALPIYFINSCITGKRIVSIPYATLCDPLICNSNDFIELYRFIKNISGGFEKAYFELRTCNSYALIPEALLPSIEMYYNGCSWMKNG